MSRIAQGYFLVAVASIAIFTVSFYAAAKAGSAINSYVRY